MKKIVYSIVILFYLSSLYSQTPVNDGSWILVTNESDEFNGTIKNIWLGGPNHPDPDPSSFFTRTYVFGACDSYPFNAFRTNNNRAFTDNNQSFRMITSYNSPPINVTTLSDGCCCIENCGGNEWCSCQNCLNKSKSYIYSSSPWLLSINAIKYGFFEARIRCTDVGSNNHNGFGPNFWLTCSSVTTNYDNLGSQINIIPSYSEIDALEFISWDANFSSPSNHMYTLNSHFKINTPCIYEGIQIDTNWNHEGTQFKGNINFANGAYHKFAVEWTPTYIKYYLDDNIMHVSSNHPSLMLPQRVVLNVNAFTNDSLSVPDANTIPKVGVPYNFDIDYIRVYKLRQNYANTDWFDCTFNSGTFNNSLYKSITFGAPGCSGYTLNAGQYRTLRAVNFIEINQAFTAELGSILTLETMPNHVQTIINVIQN